ncbi:MAG: tetratricopeptide repeat protein [Bacteroidia bacterium]|nr:tetratricopeptide repeat protein [Bacteroidia bacterium]
MKIPAFLIFVLICFAGSAQTPEQQKKIDSSFAVLKTMKQDTNRVLLLFNTSILLRKAKRTDEYVATMKEMLALCQKLNYKQGFIFYYTDLGVTLFKLNKFDEAMVALEVAEKYFINNKNQSQLAIVYGTMGNIYYQRDLFPKSLEYFLKAFKIYESLGLKKSIAGYAGNIGAIYNATGNNIKALEFYNKALIVNKEIKAERGEALNIVCIGNVYSDKKEYTLALEYFEKAMIINKKLGDKEYLANNYETIGALKLKLKQYESALENLKLARDMHEVLKNDKGLSYAYNIMGDVYYELKDYATAEKMQLLALDFANRSKTLNLKKEVHKSLSILYNETGQYKLSLENYKESVRIKDSLFSVSNEKELLQRQIEFDFEKKEALTKAEFIKQQSMNQVEIEKRKQAIILLEKDNALRKLDLTQTNLQLKEKEAESESQKKQVEILNKDKQLQTVEAQKKAKELEQQKQLRNIFIVGAILLLAFAVYILMNLSKSKRTNKIIEKQKSEVEQQKHLVEEKHKEITDSINYAERIQRSFLATKETLDENLQDYFIFFKPKDVVSGDFYWAGKLNNGNFALVTADSTGHGVPGAIMSLLNITSLEKAIEHHNQPAEIFNTTRQTIIKRLSKDGSKDGGKDGMDASLTVYDFKNKKLFTSSANNPIWLVRGNKAIEIACDKMPLGKHDLQHISFSQEEIELKEGDVVYTLTDGFADQFGGPKGKKFMSKKLRELLAANASLPMQKQKELLEKTFLEWIGSLEQVDDVTLIGVRI